MGSLIALVPVLALNFLLIRWFAQVGKRAEQAHAELYALKVHIGRLRYQHAVMEATLHGRFLVVQDPEMRQ